MTSGTPCPLASGAKFFTRNTTAIAARAGASATAAPRGVPWGCASSCRRSVEESTEEEKVVEYGDEGAEGERSKSCDDAENDGEQRQGKRAKPGVGIHEPEGGHDAGDAPRARGDHHVVRTSSRGEGSAHFPSLA